MLSTYFIDVAQWDSSSTQWHQLLRQLPHHEQKQVTRFAFANDQHLALASRLLQRKLIHDLFHIDYHAIEIVRTPENKPYWRRGTESPAPPFWNYNVSHQGTIVAIASDSRALIGVDVVRLSDRPHPTVSMHAFFHSFERHFNPKEWDYIRGTVDKENGHYARFYRLWSLKEAYIKAVGIGLGFSLLRAEFVQVVSDQDKLWALHLDGERQSDWHFTCTQIDAVHLISVASGPFSAMWKPERTSIFPKGIVTREQSAVSVAETTAWQEWTLQDLVQ